MTLFDLFTEKKNHPFISILNLLIYLALFIIPIILYLFHKKGALFVFTVVLALYPFLNIIRASNLFDFPPHKRGANFIALLALTGALANILSALYLFFNPRGQVPSVFLINFNAYIRYTAPYLAALAVLFACKSVKISFPFKNNFIFLLFITPISSIFLLYRPAYLSHFNIGLIVVVYSVFLYLIWENTNSINPFRYTYVHILVALIIINELILLLNKYYDPSIDFIILFLFISYMLLAIKSQRTFINSHVFSSKKYLLYKKNSDLMNQFLALKSLEVQTLETKMLIKDNIYKQLFDFAPDAFIISSNGVISYSNKALNTLLDAKDDQDIFKRGIWSFIHPDCMDKARANYRDLLSGKKDISISEIQLISLSQETKYVRVSASVSFVEDAHYIFCSFHDLSDYYAQERLHLELENNIAQEKFKVEFFANISHDLKTPVNVIYSAIQLQDMYIHANEYDQVLVYNDIIKQNCLRLQKLLNDILDITKMDANYLKPNLEFCNIICSIEHMVQSIRSFVENKNITITFDTNVEDKVVMTDINLIERIVLNLISNAIKYGKQDGNIWISLFDEGEHLIISVKDDGIGIPNSHLPKIFNRFHKANQASNRGTISSTGIGLSLVHSIVDTLEGIIFCLSTENIGSEFIVILPMVSHNNLDDYCCSEYASSLELSNKLNVELSDI